MKLLLIILLIPVYLMAQNKTVMFVETGVTAFKPFLSNERVINNAGTFSSNLNNTYKSPLGYFAKFGFELLPKTEKMFWVSVPMALGYKEFNKIIIQEGTTFGCFSSFDGKQTAKSSSKSISAIVGPKFNFQSKKFIVFMGLNLNSDLFFSNIENVYYEPRLGESKSYLNSDDFRVTDFMLCLSAQAGIEYKISNRWKVGISADAYIYNFMPLLNNNKQNTQLFNIGYGKQSLFFCSGIRGSYSF